jgi:integrase
LSRRKGQSGNVFQHGYPKEWNPEAPAYGRYWIDVPGAERRRRTVALGVCSTRSVARRRLREHIESEGINANQSFTSNTAPGTAFRAQAAKWIGSLSARRRRPVKPATIFCWQHALDKWILPNIGDKLMPEVSNGVLRELVDKMTAARLSTKTIVNYTQVVKLVVASVVNSEGEQIYPRQWNHDFIGLPIVDPSKQRRPTLTETELGEILFSTRPRYAVLFALLAGTGLRIGEALGLRPTDLSSDCRVLHVRRSIWGGQEQEPKTPAAVREVDIAEPLSRLLREYVSGKSGYLFATKKGRPIQQRNVLRALHATGKKVGLHSFRRFRTETLRRARVPEDLTKLWLGHSKTTVTDFYASGLSKDLAWRREWCDRVGLGFSLVGLLGLQNVVPTDSGKVT